MKKRRCEGGCGGERGGKTSGTVPGGAIIILLAAVTAAPAWSQQPQTAPAQSRPAGGAKEAGEAGDENRALLAEAQLAYIRGDWSAALAGLERGVRAYPHDALVRYQYAFCLDRIGDHDQALEHKRRARELFQDEVKNSQRWEPYYYLAALESLDFNDPSKARELAVQGLARIDESEELNGVACFQASRLAGFADRPEDAERWMERAAERFATETDPPAAYATEALRLSGEKAFRAADYERARDRLERAASLSDTAQEALYLAGAARLRLSDPAGAIETFNGLTRDPARTEAQYAIRVVKRAQALTLPEALPDGRAISGMRAEDRSSALRRACGGEFDEESETAALALLMDFLQRGQLLRDMALTSGCVDIIFR